MYSRNVTNFLLHLVQDGRIHLDLNDELTRGPLVTHQGEILHEAVKAARAFAEGDPIVVEGLVAKPRGAWVEWHTTKESTLSRPRDREGEGEREP